MNVNNNKRGSMKKALNWVTNRLDKWIKIKDFKLINVEAGDMSKVGYGMMAIAFAWIIHSGVTAYAVNKGVDIHQDVEINIIKKEAPKS
jgi:hypothetical protein